MENQISKANGNEASLTLEQIEVRMDMLIQQTKMHFLEMGKLLLEAKKIFDKKNRTIEDFNKYVENRFNIKSGVRTQLVAVSERFDNDLQDLKIPFNSYTSLYQLRGFSNEYIDELLKETFTLSDGKIKEGKDLNEKELREVLREKRELEKALEEANKRQVEEKRLAEELAKKEKELDEVRYQLEYAKKIEDTELQAKAEELAEDIVEAKKVLIENQIKEKLEEKLDLDAEKLAEQKIKDYKLSMYRTEQFHKEEKRRIEKEKDILINKQTELQKTKAIIGEGLQELEKVKKQVAEKEAYLESLKIEEDKLREDKNKIEQLHILFEKINDINTIVNRVTQEDYKIYLNDDRVKKYIEISANMLNDANNRFCEMANTDKVINVNYMEVK